MPNAWLDLVGCTEDFPVFNFNETVVGEGGAGIHHPEAILQLPAKGNVGMTEQQDISAYSTGIVNGGVVSAFHAPAVSVGEEDRLARQCDLLFDGHSHTPAVAVARDQAEGDLRVMFGHRLGVGHEIAQVNNLLGLVAVDRGVHSGQGPVRVREYQNFQTVSPGPFFAYTGIVNAVGGIMMELTHQNREAIAQLAKSGDAQKLMELLQQQSGQVKQAAQAAAAGDPGQLMAMMDQLMRSKEGAELVNRIESQAKQAGLK